MRGIFKKLAITILSLSALASCGGGSPPQISGIIAVADYETIACVPQEHTIQIRNNDTSEPQRVQGVMFEMGTNNDRYYKIEEVATNDTGKKVVGNLAEEIILPPGGVLSVKVTYNPKKVTTEDKLHYSYLDFILNGPKLGVMQVELRGKAPTAAQGCTASNLQEFEVVSIDTVVSHTSVGAVPSALDVATAVSGTFKFDIDEASGKIKMAIDGWPIITIPLPKPVGGVSEVKVSLDEDTEGTFQNGEILFDKKVNLTVTGIPLPNLTLTTGALALTSADAPNVAGGSLSLQGAKLENGEMTLVIAAALKGNSTLEDSEVGGGAFGATIKLKAK